eukprot:ANDGO_07486.mRNA.1 Protein transport protein Sec24-like CEF
MQQSRYPNPFEAPGSAVNASPQPPMSVPPGMPPGAQLGFPGQPPRMQQYGAPPAQQPASLFQPQHQSLSQSQSQLPPTWQGSQNPSVQGPVASSLSYASPPVAPPPMFMQGSAAPMAGSAYPAYPQTASSTSPHAMQSFHSPPPLGVLHPQTASGQPPVFQGSAAPMAQPLPVAQPQPQPQPQVQHASSVAQPHMQQQPSHSQSGVDASAIPSPVVAVHCTLTGSDSAVTDAISQSRKLLTLPMPVLAPSLTKLPPNKAILEQSYLPLSIIVTPFSSQLSSTSGVALDASVPLLQSAPCRCERCGGYLNPLAAFAPNTQTWTCPLCAFSRNSSPPHYGAGMVDAWGCRTDKHLHSELSNWMVEYSVGSSLSPSQSSFSPLLSGPLPMCIILDVSLHAIESSFLATVQHILGVSQMASSTPASPSSHIPVAVILVSSHVSILTHSAAGSIQVNTLADVEDVFTAVPPSAAFRPLASWDWGCVGRIVSGTKIPSSDCAFGSALALCTNLLERFFTVSSAGPASFSAAPVSAPTSSSSSQDRTPHGGRIIAFLSSSPRIGAGKLPVRPPTDEAPVSSAAVRASWDVISNALAKGGVRVDVFSAGGGTSFPSSPSPASSSAGNSSVVSSIDIPSMIVVTERTGGAWKTYSPWDASGTFAAALERDVSDALHSAFAMDVAIAVRTGSGIEIDTSKPSSVSSPGAPGAIAVASSSFVLSVPSMSVRSSVYIPLSVSDSIAQSQIPSQYVTGSTTSSSGAKEPGSVIQLAVRYMNSITRESRICVMTLPWACATNTVSALYRSASLVSVFWSFLWKAIHSTSYANARASASTASSASQQNVLSGTAAALYSSMNDSLVTLLARYRRHCTQNPSAGQLVLPETLKALPCLVAAAVHVHGALSTPHDRALFTHPFSGMWSAASLEQQYPYVLVVTEHGASSQSSNNSGFGVSGDEHASDDIHVNVVRASAEFVQFSTASHSHAKKVHIISNGSYFLVVSTDGNFPTSLAIPPVPLYAIPSHWASAKRQSMAHIIYNIWAYLQGKSPRSLKVRFVRGSQDPRWQYAMNCLVEDSQKDRGIQSYPEYICGLHKQIQNKLAREAEALIPQLHM